MTGTLLRPLIALLWMSCWTATGLAQTLPYDHVHLATPDPEAAVAWYIEHLGASASPRPDRVAFGEVLFIFQRAEGREPSAGGPVDHVGFAVANLEAKLRELEEAGVRAATAVRAVGGMKSGFIEDPWGVRIELIENPGESGFHHIHLKSAGVGDTLSWYATMFGGERQKFMGRIDAIKYGSVWLMAEEGGPLPGRRAIDHLSWRVTNVDQTTAALKAKNVKVLSEPGASPGGNRVAFVEDPAGVRIEIMQRPQ